MLSAIIFYTLLFLAVVVVPAALILAVLLLLDQRHRRWQWAAKVFAPVGASVAGGFDRLGLRQRYPRTAAFLTRRLDSHDPWGLSATVAGLGILFGLWFFLGVLQDIVAKDPLVTLDLRLHNAVPLFRSTGMTWLMLVFTQLGSVTVLALLCLGIALLALARRRTRLALAFPLALTITGLVSATLKSLFGFARPIDAILSVREMSFPSGHLLSGTVVYGLLAALLLGSGVRRGVRAIGVTGLLLVIVGIGLSRLYVGVHWPSDLLGSLALAFMVLASILFFLHHDRPAQWIDTLVLPADTRLFGIIGGAVLVIALAAVAILASQTEMLPIGPPAAARAITLQALRIALPPDLPRWSEDLVGGRMEPISLVLVGSENDLVTAFAQAGWTRADLPTPVRVVEEVSAAVRNRPDPADPAAPATPAFFADRPQGLTLEKPDTSAPSIRRRHHTRLWKTTYCLAPGCRPVWVATASYDMGIELSSRLHLPTHRIDPAVDKERALIVADLIGVGAAQEGSVPVSGRVHGKNAAGDSFETDGRAVVLVLPNDPGMGNTEHSSEGN